MESRLCTWAPSGISFPPDANGLDINSKCFLEKVWYDCLGPRLSGMKVWVTPPGESARPAKITTAECEGELRMNSGLGGG